MDYLNHIRTDNSVTVMFADREPISVTAENPNYESLVHVLDNRLFGENLSEVVNEILNPEIAIEKALDEKFKINNGVMFYNNRQVPDAIANRLIQFARQGINADPLIKFWEKLDSNPSEVSRQCLFNFLNYNRCPITPDGNFISYKYVRDDYMDCYSGTYDNTPGNEVEMDRDLVVEDPNVACASGLHAGAWEYVNGNGQRIVEVEINPVDVVSVPYDYNHQKMRICKYKVLRDCGEEIEEELRGTANKNDVILQTDADGRLNIPSNMLSEIGAEVGEKVFVYTSSPSSEAVVVSMNMPTNKYLIFSYLVNDGVRVRIGKSALESTTIGGRNKYVANIIKGMIHIKAGD